MSKNISLDALRGHLFEALEGVKNLSDPDASDCEKTSIEQASAIVDISGKIIDTYKMQLAGVALAAKLEKSGVVSRPALVLESIGVMDADSSKLLES